MPSRGEFIIRGATVLTTLSYDADSRVTTIIHDKVGGSVLETYTYDYNARTLNVWTPARGPKP